MLLAISAVFGKFVDSIEEAESLGLDLQNTETLNTLRSKVTKAFGKYED